ncbi:DUF202 domain-containing protein [Streptomyces sp. NPDC018059]|uniref:DUF202 domain-containing protein n=1 Tax=Streptomyces sp. NPDC018059 TaxID=3365041 RepID=UPI0037B60958
MPRDPGLQPERTRLAWRRTTLACTVAGGAARRRVGGGRRPVRALSAAVTGFLAVAHRRMTALSTARPRPLGPRAAVASALGATFLAVCAMGRLFT